MRGRDAAAVGAALDLDAADGRRPAMTDCLAPRHDEPEPAAPHATLCRPCTTGLRRDLRRIPHLHAALGELLDPRRAGGAGSGDGDGLPFHLPASDCRSQIAHDVEYWVTVVIAERQPNVCPVRTLPAMCGWLAGWADWASLRPWAGDMAGALSSDAGRARAVLDPMPRADIPLPPSMNWCPGCRESMVLAAVVSQAASDRRPSLVWCSACGHEWDVTQWLRLGREIIRHHDSERAIFGAVA
jgi:hypothetical protein